MSELEKQIEKETGVRVVHDKRIDFLEWSVYHPKGSDCVLETDAVVILWQALLSARKRIAELEATFPSEEEIECQAHMTRDSVGGIAGFLACADWLRERLGVK
jgi:hypothetical protein